ncbi:MAG TPA: hypothetical protein VF659_09455 [Pyrinomonadaceae bacterium]
MRLRGDFGLVEGLGLEMLTHQLGGGFYRSVLTGTRSGNRYWTLTYRTLRDTMNSPVTLPSGDLQAQAIYLWEFFHRHKTGYVEVDRPFVLTDISTGKKFLARFADHSMERTMFMVKLYTSQLKLVFARVPGFNTLPDGSHDNDSNNANI